MNEQVMDIKNIIVLSGKNQVALNGVGSAILCSCIQFVVHASSQREKKKWARTIPVDRTSNIHPWG